MVVTSQIHLYRNLQGSNSSKIYQSELRAFDYKLASY